MISKRKIWSAVAVLAAAATLGACSSSGGGSSSSGSGAANTSAGAGASGSSSGTTASGSPIKVGVICSCSGPFGTTIAAAGKVSQAWAKSVNAAGGLKGHPVELNFKDDGSDPGKTVTAAQSLISAKVDVILDLTVLDAAWEKQVSAAKIPVVGGNFSSEMYYKNPIFYPSGQTNDSIVMANILTAKAAGATNFGQLYCAESVQCQQSVEPHKKAGAKAGLPVVYNASISATAPNYTAQCLAAKKANVTALFIGHSASIVARVAEDCARQGYTPTYIEEGTGFTMQLAKTAGINDHLWAPFPILPFFADKPAVTQMNTVLDKYYPGLRTDTNVWSEYAAQAWTGLLLVNKAVEAANVQPGDEVSAAEIIKGLDTFNGETLDGWVPGPGLTFKPGQPHPVTCWYVGRLVKGTPTLANDGKPTCESTS